MNEMDIALHDNIEDTQTVLKDVKEGIYSLVNASTERFLSMASWRSILTETEFQDHCIGVAFDEAHIIAHW